MNIFFKIGISILCMGIASATFADNKFNQDLEKFIECKSTFF